MSEGGLKMYVIKRLIWKKKDDPTTLFYQDKKCIWTEFNDKSENNLK